ncbi:hypothetical protein B0H17DRAFT_1195133 [Mycena rosella]|uniref:SET domain-containing protein n=1 Tax=Mycena rosella TaxID=1033263 RepID=A0AAD7GMF1_MYCRO|nr:hypothetical protein B0H17DRAFT_1195133 [Mycena rosella]
MKRGFLNSSKAKARPLGPALQSKLIGAAAEFDVPFRKGQIAVGAPTTPTFRMAPSPGKGMGLFSTRALKMGDLILSERPLFVTVTRSKLIASLDFTEEQQKQHSRNEWERHYELCVNRMQPADKAALMALANCNENDGFGSIDGIVATNAFGLEDLGLPGREEEYIAVGKDLSRLNDNCSCNTSHRFDTPSFSYQLFAVHDIAAGEELTTGYTYLDCSTAERHQKLKPFKVVCTCAACTDRVASDARRASIALCNPGERPFSESFARVWLLDPTLPDDWLPFKCEAQLALIARESLEHLPMHCEAVTTLMEAEWAAKLDTFVWEKRHMNVKALLDPASPAYEAHPLWRKRQKSCPVSKPRKRVPLPEVVEGKIVYPTVRSK